MTTPRFTLGLLAVLALAGAAAADEVRGVVQRVDTDKKELLIEGRGRGVRGEALTFALAPDVEVLFADSPGGVSDLAPGRVVRVRFVERDGRDVAVTVLVRGKRPAAPAVAAGAGDLTGELRRVSPSDREIVVVGPGPKGPETETTLAVPDDAKILRGDKPLTFDDLKEGQQASVRVEKRDGKPTAASIQVGPGAPAPAGPEKGRVITRLRRLLQLADQILGQMERPDR
jgi:cold shock CspA family protein